MCGRGEAPVFWNAVISPYDVTTLFFSARLPKKGNFVTKKMMYKIDILIKNSYVTYIGVYTLLFSATP